MNRWMEELIEWTGEWMTFFQFRIEKKKKKNTFKTANEKLD